LTLSFLLPSIIHAPNSRLTEQGITSADVHCLDVGVVSQRVLAEFTSNTRLLEATEWCLVADHVVLVNPDGSGLQRVGDTDSCVKVGGVDGGGETIGGGIAELDGVLLGLEF